MPAVTQPPKVERFETNQSNVAAYLLFCGHHVIDSVWENETCTFFFEHTEELSKDFAVYCRGDAAVEPIAYGGAYKEIMNLVKKRRAEFKQRQG